MEKRISLANTNKNSQEMMDTTFDDRDQPSTTAGRIDESVEIKQEITHFADNDPVVDASLAGASQLPQRLLTDFHDSRTHSVISFLQRPQLLQDVTWAPGQAQGSVLTTINIPDDLFTSMVSDKLDGFGSFRADTIFRVQVNSQPFQCGRLIMAYIPTPDLLGYRLAELTRSIDRLVALPHVQIDISEQSEVTLRVPYVSPYNAYNLIEGRLRWGRVVLAVYSPLNQVSQPSLKVNIFGYFDNVQLGFPTLGVLASQAINSAQEQVGLNSSADIAKKAEAHGLISGIAGVIDNVVQKGADIVTAYVPAAKKFTDPLAKVADAAFDIINLIPGMRKPDPVTHGSVILTRPMQYFGNVDGLDHSQKLALHAQNRIDIHPSFAGSNLDEMSFDYVKRVPNYISSFSFSSTNNYGDSLWFSLVSPCYRSADYIATNGSRNFTFPTPTSLSYAISSFNLWRGSLVYTFRAVKTEYHSGRLEFSFSPFVSYSSYEDNRTDRSEYVYKVILDLRKQTEISFTVPFVSTTPYKRINSVQDPLATNTLTDTVTNQFATGVLGVRALTPLVLGSTVVPSTIQILVEVKGGPDFEVECPVESDWIPLGNLSTSSDTVASEPVSTAQEQTGFASTGQYDVRSDYLEDKIEIKDITGISSNVNLNSSKAMACIGESFGNYRDLIKRFGWYESGTTFSNDNYVEVRNPLLMRSSVLDISGSGLRITASSGTCPVRTLAQMYAFVRGGFRTKLATRNGVNSSQLVEAVLLPSDTTAMRQQPFTMQPLHYEQEIKNIYEFSWPFYSPAVLTTPYIQQEGSDDIIHQAVFPRIYFQSSHTYSAALAAADDFDMGFYLGAPLAFSWNIENAINRIIYPGDSGAYGFLASPYRNSPTLH
nr:MAG: capsid protein precursor [Triatovirus sp.]